MLVESMSEGRKDIDSEERTHFPNHPSVDGKIRNFIVFFFLNFNLLLSSYQRPSEVHRISDYFLRLIESIDLSLESHMYRDSSKAKLAHLTVSSALQ